jgi:putative ABC transport system permease protein
MANFGVKAYNLFEGVLIALDSIRSNKVRAGLTILGIAVGVFVVVVISASIHGINDSVAKDLESAGPTTFFLSRYPISLENCDHEGACKWLNNPPLTMDEVKAIGALPDVKASSAQMSMSREVRFRDVDLTGTQVIGYTANWTIVDHAGNLDPGRSFTEAEAEAGAKVVIINDEMSKKLFGDADPLRQVIHISGVPFTVIGEYHYEASFLTGGATPRAVIPIQTAVRVLHARYDDMGVAIVPRDSVDRDAVIDQVTAVMRGHLRLRPAEENTFAIITQDKIFEVYNKIFGMFFLVMIVLSAIGLMVGGVGVVAIMMISVTERTREIGVRKALGATRGTIMWQFLVEAVTLTGIGAIAGLIVGTGVAFIISHVSPIHASVPPLAIVAALATAAFTGVIFGIVPAARASRLDPVEALRYE